MTTPQSRRLDSSSIELAYYLIGLLILLLYFGGQFSSISLAALWFAQCSLGFQVCRLFLRRVVVTQGIFIFVGPSYLVGFLLTTWTYMLIGGGDLARVVVYAILALTSYLTLKLKVSDLSNAKQLQRGSILILNCTFLAMTWEFPELIVPAIGLWIFTISCVLRVTDRSWRMVGLGVGLSIFLSGAALRGPYWYLESDDLPNRMAEGILTVSRGYVASVGAYPFDRYHWVSPVGVALQAELTNSPIVFVFTVFAPVAFLTMMAASFGLLVNTFSKPKNFKISFLLVTTLFFLIWRVQLDTEAVIGRFASIFALICLARAFQLEFSEKRSSLVDFFWTSSFAAVLGSMLYLFRPDLIALVLLLYVGVPLSLLNTSDLNRYLLLGVTSIIALVTGILSLNIVLPLVSKSELSYASLLVDWRPPDMGWCSRRTLGAEMVCLIMLNINLWAAAAVALAAGLSSQLRYRGVFAWLSLLIPSAVSYFVFFFTLTSDFPSAIEAFLQIGLVASHLLVLVHLCLMADQMKNFEKSMVVTCGVLFALVHLFFRSILEERLARAKYLVPAQIGALTQLPSFQWLTLTVFGVVVCSVLRKFVGIRTQLWFPSVLVTAFLVLQLFNSAVARPLQSDVNPALISNAIGPQDVFAVGEWLRENSEPTAIVATNYQCPPQEAERCMSVLLNDESRPRATANWMLMAVSRREFLFLSQPWYDTEEYFELHNVSVAPATAAPLTFTELVNRGVDYYIGYRFSSSPDAWIDLTAQAAYRTSNFAVVPIGSNRNITEDT